MIQNPYKRIKYYYEELYDKDLLHYSASLSFHTILSIFPLLMLSFSIFIQLPSFEKYYNKIKEFIFSNLLPSHQDTVGQYMEQFLSNGSNLGTIGLIGVIFTSIMFFADYEYIINKIMKTGNKGFWKSFSFYWTLITLGPLGLGFSFYLTGIIQKILDKTEYTSSINILSVFPYLVIWIIFAITYSISINKDIKFKYILLSSFVASLVWDISKIFFIKYTFYNKTYLSIYGSFSILLFFFLWIYIGWIIFLYGVKFCYFLDQKKWKYPKERDNDSQDIVSN